MNRARKGIKSYKREIAVEFRMRRKEAKRKNRRGSTSNGNTSW